MFKRWGYVGPRYEVRQAQAASCGVVLELLAFGHEGLEQVEPLALRAQAMRIALLAHGARVETVLVDVPAWLVLDLVDQIAGVGVGVVYPIDAADGSVSWYDPEGELADDEDARDG